MKTKLLFAVIILLLAFSCSSPKYLPSSDKIDINEFGSYIKISMKEGGKIDGELIAIDSSQIVILSAKKKKPKITAHNLLFTSMRCRWHTFKNEE